MTPDVYKTHLATPLKEEEKENVIERFIHGEGV